MIVHECDQGSPQWLKLRAGIPTASKLGVLISPVKVEPSVGRGGTMAKGVATYLAKLAAEYMDGGPVDDVDGIAHMERGTMEEQGARAYYQWEAEGGAEITEVGFCTTDDKRFGASPDGLVGDDGGVEIKCPMLPTFTKYLLDPDLMVLEHSAQVQGNLFVTGRKWWDLVSYNKIHGGVVVRLTPDPKWQRAIRKALYGTADFAGFSHRLGQARMKIDAHREAREAHLIANPPNPFD